MNISKWICRVVDILPGFEPGDLGSIPSRSVDFVKKY